MGVSKRKSLRHSTHFPIHDASQTEPRRRVTRSMTNSKPEASATIKSERRSTQPRSRRRKVTSKPSHIHPDPDTDLSPPTIPPKPPRQPLHPLSSAHYGLIQETIAHNLYFLVVQAILWNQTAGKQARPVLNELLSTYPTPQALAAARFEDVAEMLYPIGLYNSRAKRLLDMAAVWLGRPPVAGRGYEKVRDRKYAAVPIEELEIQEEKASEVEGEESDGVVKADLSDEVREAEIPTDAKFWEIAHLPGVGPYALDSFRIFHRDEMRGLAKDWLGRGTAPGFEPEWKRVVPTDKELRSYLKWLWVAEGWDWDWGTGQRKRIE